MEKGKNIMLISSQNVFNPGSGVESRISNLVKILSKDNSLFIFAPKQDLKEHKGDYYGLTYNSRFQKLYDKRIFNLSQNIPSDLVLATTLWSGLNGFIMGRKLKKPFYFDEHNVEFLRFKRAGSKIWPLVYLFERFICKRADKIICVSEIDKSYLIKYFQLNPEKIEIIENPVDNNIFYSNNKNNPKIRKELEIRKDEKYILFFGQLDYQPNIEALEIIRDKILPGLDKRNIKYKLVICGKGDGKGLLNNFKHQHLIFRGFVERIQDYINASDIVIVPLKSGSGTRIKILESLACKKKVISTSIGAEGIKSNKYLVIEDDWEKFCEKI